MPLGDVACRDGQGGGLAGKCKNIARDAVAAGGRMHTSGFKGLAREKGWGQGKADAKNDKIEKRAYKNVAFPGLAEARSHQREKGRSWPGGACPGPRGDEGMHAPGMHDSGACASRQRGIGLQWLEAPHGTGLMQAEGACAHDTRFFLAACNAG